MSALTLPRWLHPTRWENYALLAMASVAFLVVVALRCSGTARMPAAAAGAASEPQPALPAHALPERSRAAEPQWLTRHKAITAKAAANRYDVMLLGDSLTQGWEFNDVVWQSYFPGVRALNAGISSDRIEHVLWRVDHGLFDVARPHVVVLLVGINNLAMNAPGDIAGGVGQVVRAIERHSPATRILLLDLLPAGKDPGTTKRARIQRVNAGLAALAEPGHVEVLDVGSHLLESDGSLSHATSFDYLHLTHDGYDRLAKAIQPKLLKLLGP